MSRQEIRLSQVEDHLLDFHEVGRFRLRFASLRSKEAKDVRQPSQDYLTMLIGDNELCFVVCDGVSQSFFGDFAARFLGDRLLKWLEGHVPATIDPKIMAHELYGYLMNLHEEAEGQLADISYDENLPELLQEVLEEKRKRGSETTFVCGRIDFPNEKFPRGRAIFSWLGNTRIRLGRDSIWGILISKEPDANKGRWSTCRGLVGEKFSVAVQEIFRKGKPRFNRVLVYTDGVSALDEISERPGDRELSELIAESVSAADGDDATFLEIEITERVAYQ